MFRPDAVKALYENEIAMELPVILVDRGNCHFTEKVRNVEATGAYVALVGDSFEE